MRRVRAARLPDRAAQDRRGARPPRRCLWSAQRCAENDSALRARLMQRAPPRRCGPPTGTGSRRAGPTSWRSCPRLLPPQVLSRPPALSGLPNVTRRLCCMAAHVLNDAAVTSRQLQSEAVSSTLFRPYCRYISKAKSKCQVSACIQALLVALAHGRQQHMHHSPVQHTLSPSQPHC